MAALGEWAHEDRVQEWMVRFQTEFQIACRQIKALADLKDVHDLLHQLQFLCYDRMVQEARQAPGEEGWENLKDHEITLEGIVSQLWDIASRATLTARDTSWIQTLEQAQEELNGAIENADHGRLKRAIWLLNRILAVQPSVINTRLNHAARTLQLQGLVRAMRAIGDKMSGSGLDSKNMQQFKSGVDALERLNDRLATLIDLHDKWQRVDLEVRRVKANLDRDLLELEMSWPELKAMTESLMMDPMFGFNNHFEKSSTRLENALASADKTQAKRYFRRYHRQASNTFYRVDLALKGLCEDLRTVGQPLSSFLAIAQ